MKLWITVALWASKTFLRSLATFWCKSTVIPVEPFGNFGLSALPSSHSPSAELFFLCRVGFPKLFSIFQLFGTMDFLLLSYLFQNGWCTLLLPKNVTSIFPGENQPGSSLKSIMKVRLTESQPKRRWCHHTVQYIFIFKSKKARSLSLAFMKEKWLFDGTDINFSRYKWPLFKSVFQAVCEKRNALWNMRFLFWGELLAIHHTKSTGEYCWLSCTINIL